MMRPSRSSMIVPTLCVGMNPGTLRVTSGLDAQRPGRHSHAERGNDHSAEDFRASRSNAALRSSLGNPPSFSTAE